MAEDFNGSIAQEDIQFITGVTTEAVVGENYFNLMVFAENTRYIEDPAAFVDADDAGDIQFAELTVDNYALVVKGRLKLWLDDFFAVQTTSKAFVVLFCPDLTADADWNTVEEQALEDAFNLLKQKAYFKAIIVGTTVATSPCLPAAVVALADLCSADPLLSSPAMATAVKSSDYTTDPIYAALKTADADAFVVLHEDLDRNGAFFQLSISLSVLNNSGTPVGNSFDFVGNTGITASGPDGTPLSVTVQSLLKTAKISYFKPTGDSTGACALVGASSIKGEVVPALWIVRYCNYRCKVQVAGYVTRMNTLRDNTAYQAIINIMTRIVELFTEDGSRRITGFSVTAPLFKDLPDSGSTIIVPNAWSGTYVDNVRRVQVYGNLTILEG